jgi:hypothetical protein
MLTGQDMQSSLSMLVDAFITNVANISVAV